MLATNILVDPNIYLKLENFFSKLENIFNNNVFKKIFKKHNFFTFYIKNDIYLFIKLNTNSTINIYLGILNTHVLDILYEYKKINFK